MTEPTPPENPLAQSLADMPWLAEALAKGYPFNAYDRGGFPDEWYVGIGPVTDFATILTGLNWQTANLITDALRHAAGQPPALSRAFETDEDDYDDD